MTDNIKAADELRPQSLKSPQSPLAEVKIAVPESRRLDVLSNLFEIRGAEVWRCPLVAIYDSPNEDAIYQWLNKFINGEYNFLVVLTGEGLRRLHGFAERADLLDGWIAALQKVTILARGPKPNGYLKSVDLKADMLASYPTTDGIMATLDTLDLSDKKMAVQLYGEDPNEKLQEYLRQRGASYETVSPYIYASDVETEKVVETINKLDSGYFDLICFTSKSQYQRLEKVAKKHSITDALSSGLKKTKIAAVGPVVRDQLTEAGFEIAIMPEGKFFMQPMVKVIEGLFAMAYLHGRPRSLK